MTMCTKSYKLLKMFQKQRSFIRSTSSVISIGPSIFLRSTI